MKHSFFTLVVIILVLIYIVGCGKDEDFYIQQNKFTGGPMLTTRPVPASAPILPMPWSF